MGQKEPGGALGPCGSVPPGRGVAGHRAVPAEERLCQGAAGPCMRGAGVCHSRYGAACPCTWQMRGTSGDASGGSGGGGVAPWLLHPWVPLPHQRRRGKTWWQVHGDMHLTARGCIGVGQEQGRCWGAGSHPHPRCGQLPHATPSPLSAGSQSDAYRKASAAGCSPCEPSPAATPLGEPGTRASGDETPATPKGGHRAPTARPCLRLPRHIPAA